MEDVVVELQGVACTYLKGILNSLKESGDVGLLAGAIHSRKSGALD